MKKNRFKEKVDWDNMTHGEASHHIGKKMTERTHKSKKDYTRNTKHKNRDDFDN
jgi:stalled ribosome alternative rescue factor ArfA